MYLVSYCSGIVMHLGGVCSAAMHRSGCTLAEPFETLVEQRTTHVIAATHLLMVHNLVEVGFEVFGQQNSFQPPGGNAAPVKVLHPERPPELQLRTMEQVGLAHHRRLTIPGCCPVPHHTSDTWGKEGRGGGGGGVGAGYEA